MLHHGRTWIEISSGAIRSNLRQFQRLVGSGVRIMPIIKANAYGHGLSEIFTIIKNQSVALLGVAYGGEALQLRDLGWKGRLVVLSHWTKQELPYLITDDDEVVVWDKESYQAVQQVGKLANIKPKIHLKLDTGTTRIGFLPNDMQMIASIMKNPRVRVVGVFSHFANAEEQSTKRTLQQLKRFTTLLDQGGVITGNRGAEPHIACTAAILRYPEARFGLVRLGIGLYGLWPSTEIQAWSEENLAAVKLRPALSWYSRLAQVKTVPPRTGIGYGSTVVAKKSMRVGVIPVGYADGYDRRLSNRGHVIIGGRRAPILGRICMNLMMVNVSNIPTAKPGSQVTLLGDGVTADMLAAFVDSINYEVTTRINWSIPRYVTT